MFMALSFVIISFVVGYMSIFKTNQFPKDKFSEKKNYYLIGIYSSMGAFVDLLLTLIISVRIPYGEYGTGIEILVALIVLLIYGLPCIISSINLKKKMITKKMRSPHGINALICSVFFKFVFAFIITIFICEVV